MTLPLFPETGPTPSTRSVACTMPAPETVKAIHASCSALLELLDTWVDCGWLRALDLAFTRFLHQEVPAASPALLLAAALTSHQLGRGHVCLDLAAALREPHAVLSLPPEDNDTPVVLPILRPADLLAHLTLNDWRNHLRCPALVSEGEGTTPLVLKGERLYLRRYWQHERTVEHAIALRLANTAERAAPIEQAPGHFRALLDTLFAPAPKTASDPAETPAHVQAPAQPDWQKIACALAARSTFSIITGGPGTGKTTTVVRLLALLQALALNAPDGRALEIRLAAPTGKAAARLKESILFAINTLPHLGTHTQAIRAAIPADVSTLHRLLGPVPGSRQFRHTARNPLELDVLVIDEASMIDLEMMSCVLAALPAHARLVILGDKDQLASVEAGSVLGALCSRAVQGHYRTETVHWLQTHTGESIPPGLENPQGTVLDQHIVMLRTSRRFAPGSGIGQLAQAINCGHAASIDRLLHEKAPDLRFMKIRAHDDPVLSAMLLSKNEDTPGYAPYLDILKTQKPGLDANQEAFEHWATSVLQGYGQFQLLCALRGGPLGVEGMNATIETLLHGKGLIERTGPWYEGRPVLMTRNDYALGLMNGDIGMTLCLPVQDRTTGQLKFALRVAFPDPGKPGAIRWVLPSRLSAVETVFAMTVHKSQGSEFHHCALLLPPARSPIMTRELVYTAITRARKQFSLITPGTTDTVVQMALRTVERSGGLFVE